MAQAVNAGAVVGGALDPQAAVLTPAAASACSKLFSQRPPILHDDGLDTAAVLLRQPLSARRLWALTAAYVAQLEASGLWHWAVFVLQRTAGIAAEHSEASSEGLELTSGASLVDDGVSEGAFVLDAAGGSGGRSSDAAVWAALAVGCSESARSCVARHTPPSLVLLDEARAYAARFSPTQQGLSAAAAECAEGWGGVPLGAA